MISQCCCLGCQKLWVRLWCWGVGTGRLGQEWGGICITGMHFILFLRQSYWHGSIQICASNLAGSGLKQTHCLGWGFHLEEIFSLYNSPAGYSTNRADPAALVQGDFDGIGLLLCLITVTYSLLLIGGGVVEMSPFCMDHYPAVGSDELWLCRVIVHFKQKQQVWVVLNYRKLLLSLRKLCFACLHQSVMQWWQFPLVLCPWNLDQNKENRDWVIISSILFIPQS